MGTVNGATYVASQQSNAAETASSAANIGKDEFLKLLVAQLEHQDPMNPVDNQQFLAQLASFSSLEQLISINDGVTKLSAAMAETNIENSTAS
jgi:flagellar basal-body rod modification protein FlgD